MVRKYQYNKKSFTGMKGLILQIFSYLGSTLLVQATGFISLILIMQNMDIAEFGIYSYVTEFVGIFLFIADGGLIIYLIKEVTKDSKNYLNKYKTAQSLQYIISVALLCTILLTSYFLNDLKYFSYILIYSIGIVILSIFNPINGLWIGLNKTKLIVFKDIYISFSKIAYILVGILFSLGVFYYLFSSIIVGILWLFVVMFINKKSNDKYLTTSIKINEVSKYFISGIPFLLLLLTNALYNKIDIIMIERILGLEAVSYYSAASKFIYPFGFISTALMNSIFPRMVSTFEIRGNQNKIFIFSVLSLAVIGILIAVILWISGGYIFQLLFQNKYLNSIPIFNILIFFIPISFILCSVGNFLIAADKLIHIISINICMILLNIYLNSKYIPIYGLKAAAYSTLLCELLVLIISVFLAVKILIKSNK